MPLDPEVAAFLETQKGRPPRGDMTVAQTREAYLGARGLAGEPPELAAVEEVALPGGLRGREYRPAAEAAPLLVYFHGGRFFSGDLDTHDTVCRSLALGAECRVLAVDYRLAPEHRFPAAVEDAVAAVCWAVEREERVGVAGDSAGGNLAAAAAQALRGSPRLRCQALVYPMLDATCALPSHAEFASGYGPGSADMQRGYREYLPEGADLRDPRLSPLYAADLSGLPPAFVLTAGYDPLRDEGEEYARRLERAGVPVALKRYEGAIHGFFQMGGVLRVAREAVEDACAFLRARL
jgi:acetyl esterase